MSDSDPGTMTDPPLTSMSRQFTAWRALLPAAAFLGGFVWDAVTLGRQIKSSDLLILTAYFLASAAILVLMGRRIEFRGSSKLNLALQFLFGGMFSALLVLYFLSSGAVKTFVVVAGLAVMLLTNEFLGEKYRRLSVSWAVFGACGVMLLNFLLPHVFRSISPAWFYLSLGAATGLVVVLQRVSRDEEAAAWPTMSVAALLAILHLFNFIPPVPLVSRAMVVATEVGRDGDFFVVRGRATPGLWPVRPTTLRRAPGEPVYCFTSVFLPKGIQTTITHQWMKLDESTGEWKTTDRISFPIVGGRRGGFRGYTLKKTVTDGEWEVVAQSEAGSVIAATRFRVSSNPVPRGRSFDRRF